MVAGSINQPAGQVQGAAPLGPTPLEEELGFYIHYRAIVGELPRASIG
jgi:hypothetical protein